MALYKLSLNAHLYSTCKTLEHYSVAVSNYGLSNPVIFANVIFYKVLTHKMQLTPHGIKLRC